MSEHEGKRPPQSGPGKNPPAGPPESPQTVSLLKNGKPARILHCDDEPALRESIRIILRWSFTDYDLVQCRDTDGMLHEIDWRTPDLLITDCRHPRLGFPETLPFLYERPGRFPILVVSAALCFRSVVDQLLAFPGFDVALLNKPFDIASFRNGVLRFLGPNARNTNQLVSLARPGRTARILLLDDDPAARDLVRTMLDRWFWNYQLIECATGGEAWEEISRRRPDLWITDYDHPGFSLEELLHRCYRRPLRFPILVSSRYVAVHPGLQRDLPAWPFDIRLLNKPFALEDLKSRVMECLPGDGLAA
ncbi:MAG: response regulator [Verrucomicrobiota bacterium]